MGPTHPTGDCSPRQSRSSARGSLCLLCVRIPLLASSPGVALLARFTAWLLKEMGMGDSVCTNSCASSLLHDPCSTRPTAALTSAEAIDQRMPIRTSGSIMIWRAPNNPLGLPGGLATCVTAVLIHPQTILTAGHFAARSGRDSSGQLPPWLRIVASFAPNALDQSTWIDLNRALRHVLRSSFFSEALHPTELPVRRHRRPV